MDLNPGKSMIAFSGYKDVNSNTVSFGIAPRINACGRMGYEEEALKLFLTENLVEADSITNKLNEYNKERQAIEKRIFEGQAYNQLVKDVAADVLGNISATVDVSEILGQIDELDKAIKKLGK